MNKFFIYPDFKKHRAGLTIIELLTVAGIIAMMVAISIPAIRAMQNSFDSTGAESMINAALSTARTLAISNQQYVGVRFQKAGDMNDVLNADQYMIFVMFIESREAGNNVDVFRTIEGYKPIKFPENVGVMDLTGITALNNDSDLIDPTTFSMVFSPAGKLVTHDIRVKFRDYNDPNSDDIFNTETRVKNGQAMFIQDDGTVSGIDKEQSRNQLVIYNRRELGKYAPADRYNKYLKDLPVLYINPYTGGIIEK
jgi:Tfp pilus assembly protein FimT